MSNYLRPELIKEYVDQAGVKKAERSVMRSFMLAFMGGMFIALACIGSIIATFTINNYSVASVVAGVVFSSGLMMVMIAGGDLFTGNVLMITAVLKKKVTPLRMLVSLATAFAGNLAGALFVALLINYSGLLHRENGILMQKLIIKAWSKMNLPFMEAMILGVLCNLLVCLAVWMMYSSKDAAGKVLVCIFPISLFIMSGYEHIVANMYILPAGILAAAGANNAAAVSVSQEVIAQMTWMNIGSNFIPVTIGNLIGGLIIGLVYSFTYFKKEIKGNTNNVINVKDAYQ